MADNPLKCAFCGKAPYANMARLVIRVPRLPKHVEGESLKAFTVETGLLVCEQHQQVPLHEFLNEDGWKTIMAQIGAAGVLDPDMTNARAEALYPPPVELVQFVNKLGDNISTFESAVRPEMKAQLGKKVQQVSRDGARMMRNYPGAGKTERSLAAASLEDLAERFVAPYEKFAMPIEAMEKTKAALHEMFCSISGRN